MKKILIAAAAAVFLAGTGHAAVLDFRAEANGNERGVANGDSVVMSGVNVTFNSSHTAYLDSGNAGLGVCKVWTGTATVNDNECNPSSDDNVTFGEFVTISFDFAMDLSNLLFSQEGHTLFPAGDTRTLLFGVNGAGPTVITFGELMLKSFTNVLSATFAFDDANYNQGRQTAEQFYLASATVEPSAVPLPAALPMLLAGLGGLGALARRRKAAA